MEFCDFWGLPAPRGVSTTPVSLSNTTGSLYKRHPGACLTHLTSPSERRGNNVKRFKDFDLKMKARIWPRLCYVCHIRSTAVECRTLPLKCSKHLAECTTHHFMQSRAPEASTSDQCTAAERGGNSLIIIQRFHTEKG